MGSTVLSTKTSMVGYAVTQTVPAGTTVVGAGSTSTLDGYIKGLITSEGPNANEFGVKVVSHVSAAGVETPVDYSESGIYRFTTGNTITGTATTLAHGVIGIHTVSDGDTTTGVTTFITGARDWFGEQTLTLTGAGSTITWNSIVDKPGTSSYAAARNARFDEVHVVAVSYTNLRSHETRHDLVCRLLL